MSDSTQPRDKNQIRLSFPRKDTTSLTSSLQVVTSRGTDERSGGAVSKRTSSSISILLTEPSAKGMTLSGTLASSYTDPSPASTSPMQNLQVPGRRSPRSLSSKSSPSQTPSSDSSASPTREARGSQLRVGLLPLDPQFLGLLVGSDGVLQKLRKVL